MKLTFCLLLGGLATSTIVALSPPVTTNCSFMCSDLYIPVCGSSGVTYPNECFLSLADCERSEEITKVHDGKCSTTSETSSTDTSGSMACSDVCPLIYKPVCGSDGVTYSNDCLLNYAQCKSEGAITLVSEGQCPGYGSGTSDAGSAGCSDVCIEIFRPVCGSDGVTYANSCFLGIATCNDPSIILAHNGACTTGSEGSSSQETTIDSEASSSSSSCPSICLAIYAPVCGSDGSTYGNECKLEVASCNNPDLHITKAYDGVCSPVECKTY